MSSEHMKRKPKSGCYLLRWELTCGVFVTYIRLLIMRNLHLLVLSVLILELPPMYRAGDHL